jgi:hypothetical protein
MMTRYAYHFSVSSFSISFREPKGGDISFDDGGDAISDEVGVHRSSRHFPSPLSPL